MGEEETERLERLRTGAMGTATHGYFLTSDVRWLVDRLTTLDAAARVVVADDHQMRSSHAHWEALYAALGVPRGTEAERWAAGQVGRHKTDDEIVAEYKARGIGELRQARESYGNDRWGRSMFPPLMHRALDELYAESTQRRMAGA